MQVQPELSAARREHRAAPAHDARRAEAAILSLSDFLRMALLRTRRPDWSERLEAQYVRLQNDVNYVLQGETSIR